MIKVVAPAQHHPENRTLEEFHRYWGETHGPLFANTASLRRYVQHLTLPEAYGGEPAPTFDGVSMFWYEELETEFAPAPDAETAELVRAVLGTRPEIIAPVAGGAASDDRKASLVRAVLKDDMQLFDRSLTWPMHHKRAFLAAEEIVIVDGETAPSMVKAIFIVSKLSGLTLSEFFERWEHVLGPLAARAPGLRRYVQNHGIAAAYGGSGNTHNGWSELWFDDLGSLRAALASPEWEAVRAEGAMLFAPSSGGRRARAHPEGSRLELQRLGSRRDDARGDRCAAGRAGLRDARRRPAGAGKAQACGGARGARGLDARPPGHAR